MSNQKIKFMTLLLAVFISGSACAQDSLRSSIEVGVNAFNLVTVHMPIANHPGEYHDPNFMNGVILKVHYPNISMRIAADHFNYLKEIKANNAIDGDTINSTNNYKNTIIAVGFEKISKRLDKGFFQFYYGADISMFRGDFSSSNTSISQETNYESEISQMGVGLNAFLGVRLIAWKFLVFSWEPSMNLTGYKQQEQRTYITPSTEEGNISSYNFEAKPNLVNRLSVSFKIPTQKRG